MRSLITAVFLLLFISFTKAVTNNKRQVVDLQSNNNNTADSDEASTPVNQNIYNTKSIFSTEPSIADINDFVQTQLYCDVDTTLCKKIEYALMSAARRFSEVVKLKTKIVFQTRYYSFCIYECSNNTYGWGTPSSQFTLISLNEADSNFIYPQALAKQLAQFTDSSNWATYDVSVDINHDIYMNNLPAADDLNATNISANSSTKVPLRGGYWFNETGIHLPANYSSPSSNTSIEDYQIDLEYVILHQMIHGLGMVSSWAPYFSDLNSPFQKLLNGLITPEDSLKVMTPSPYWYVTDVSGPAYITGFQPNLIFDKFLNLFFSAQNETISLMDYGFDMQNFCVDDDDAFILYFMNAFLNNATQSTRAKRIYVAMSEENTMTFQFNTTCTNSVYFTDPYLNKTYHSMKLMTGMSVLNTSQVSYYRPGISTSHVDDSYIGTPDFLMTHVFAKGKSLQTMIDEAYATVPGDIKYNITETITVNVTTYHNVTVNNHTVLRNETSTETRQQTTEHVYRSAIGPGILRILETLGYSTVLTNTNYTTSVMKTSKPQGTCDNNNNNNFHARSDQVTYVAPVKSTSSASFTLVSIYLYYMTVFILLCVL